MSISRKGDFSTFFLIYRPILSNFLEITRNTAALFVLRNFHYYDLPITYNL